MFPSKGPHMCKFWQGVGQTELSHVGGGKVK